VRRRNTHIVSRNAWTSPSSCGRVVRVVNEILITGLTRQPVSPLCEADLCQGSPRSTDAVSDNVRVIVTSSGGFGKTSSLARYFSEAAERRQRLLETLEELARLPSEQQRCSGSLHRRARHEENRLARLEALFKAGLLNLALADPAPQEPAAKRAVTDRCQHGQRFVWQIVRKIRIRRAFSSRPRVAVIRSPRFHRSLICRTSCRRETDASCNRAQIVVPVVQASVSSEYASENALKEFAEKGRPSSWSGSPACFETRDATSVLPYKDR
jgi:hypothetical protein